MPANPHRGEVEFEACGDIHKIKFGTNAQCALEAEFGCGLDSVMEQINGSERSISNLRKLFRSVLVGDYTLEQVGELMDEMTGAAMLALFNQAVDLARARVRENSPRPTKRAAPNGAGRNASPSASVQV